nr:sigma factor [Mediterraneibacter gnavus]
MKSFPNPLTPSEEKEYIQKYTEGDLQAKHILIERNLRLVAHVIKKYQYVDEDPEDLISIGTIGLIKAIVTFNPSKGNRLAAYASKCVEKATPPLWLHS